MDHRQRIPPPDLLADPGQIRKPDRGVHPVALAQASAAEVYDRQPQGLAVNRGDIAACQAGHVADHRGGGQAVRPAVHEIGRTALRCDHPPENLGRSARFQRLRDAPLAVQRIRRDAAKRQGLAAQGHRDVPKRGIDRGAGQRLHHLDHLQRVARCRRQRLGHVGDQGRGHAARALRGGDQRAGQSLGIFHPLHEGAGAAFDIQNKRFQARRQLFRQDRGGDQVNRFHRAGDIADRIKPPIRRGDFLAGRDDGAVDALDLAAQLVFRQARAKAGDRFQFVQRAAGMPKPAARNHRDEGSASRQRRREQQRDTIADAAGRMLVDHRPVKIPSEHLPRIAHRPGQRDAAGLSQPLEQHRHGKGSGLGIGDCARGKARRKPAKFVRGRWLSVADAGDDRSGVDHVRPICAAVKSPGSRSATVIVLRIPSVVQRVTCTSGPANSAIFWRQPPQGGTGDGLSAITSISAICVSPAATIAAIAPASAQVPSG